MNHDILCKELYEILEENQLLQVLHIEHPFKTAILNFQRFTLGFLRFFSFFEYKQLFTENDSFHLVGLNFWDISHRLGNYGEVAPEKWCVEDYILSFWEKGQFSGAFAVKLPGSNIPTKINFLVYSRTIPKHSLGHHSVVLESDM